MTDKPEKIDPSSDSSIKQTPDESLNPDAPEKEENALEQENPKEDENNDESLKEIVLSEEDYQVAATIFEALLFSSEEPLTSARVRDVFPSNYQIIDIRRLVKALNEAYLADQRSFEIRPIAGGYQMFTRPEFSEYVEKLYSRRSQNRLSAKALETLAIIAYKQPVTRLEIEEIRGVSADGVLRTLLSRDLVTIAGQASTPGNPFLYKTSRTFLEYFGLKTIKDLPRLRELDEIVEADTDIKERFGEEFLKEITPELLGMKAADESEDDTTSDPETSDDSGDQPENPAVNADETRPDNNEIVEEKNGEADDAEANQSESKDV